MTTNPLDLLSQTLAATADEDHRHRHELEPVRKRGRTAIEAARSVESLTGELPEEVALAARRLDDLVRNTPGDGAQILEALSGFRREVATGLVLDGDMEHVAGIDLGGIAAAVADARRQAETAASEIDRLLDSAQRLVTRAANDELAKHYRDRANDEGKAADRWRFFTIVGFVGTIALGAVTAGLSILGNRTVQEILGAGTFSVAIGAFTAFLASQSKVHRDRETTFRQAELKLAVVSPMLDAISAEARDEMQVQVVKLLFETERPPGAAG